MSEKQVNKIIAETFIDVADALDAGLIKKNPLIAIVDNSSELGIDNLKTGAELARKRGFRSIVIDGSNSHSRMDQLITSGEIDGAVTMHYSFPIGVSTVGRVITPATGKEMFLATTTGTSHTNRIEAMVRNAIYGIIVAKASGVECPTVGIANIDGARQTERALLKLKAGGYDITFATSSRADGGMLMRGNDVLQGTADVMVLDSLTGNLMTKMLSAYSTGGNYESLGFGYGPGIGEGYNKIILIVSRASGVPVIASAVEYATELINNKVDKVAELEFIKANNAGLSTILKDIGSIKTVNGIDKIEKPDKEVVTSEIHGIEVTDIDDAASVLWDRGIYAETGMGCTGPVILVSNSNEGKARDILIKAKYIS